MSEQDTLYNVIRDGMHRTVHGSKLKGTDVVTGLADVYEQDTREKLEADVVSILRNAANQTSINTSIGDMLRYTVPGSGAAPWQLEEDACEALASIAERQIAELTAERDELQGAIDAMGNGQMYALYKAKCEECEHLQKVVKIQAESFKGMERELAQARKGVNG